MSLNLDPNIALPDEFYAALLAAHENLDAKSSQELNARLILILANQIGDIETLKAAISAAQ